MSIRRFPPLALLCVGQTLLIGAIVLWQWEPIEKLISDWLPGNPALDRAEEFVARFPDQACQWIRIEEKSGVPDPERSPYPDCLGVCLARIHDGETFSQEFLLALPAFVGREMTAYAELSPEAEMVTHLVPFTEAPPGVQGVQTSDDTGRFDLPLYYSADLLLLTKSLSSGDISGLDLSSSLPETKQRVTERRDSKLNWDLNPGAIQDHRRMSRERIASWLQSSGGDWQAWFADAGVVRERHVIGALETGGSYFAFGSHFYEPRYSLGYRKTAMYGEAAPAVAMLISLHEELKRNRIHLVIVPIPSRDEVAMVRAVPEDLPRNGILSPERQLIIDRLLAHEVDVVDVLSDLLEMPEEELPFYDGGGHHIAPAAGVEISRVLANLLESYGVPRKPAIHIPREHRTFRVSGEHHSYRENSVYEALTLSVSASTLPRLEGVLLAGDCQAGVPNHFGHSQASLYDHLSWELGARPSFISHPGESSRIYHHLKRNESLLEKARVVLFVFDSSVLTGSGQWESFRSDKDPSEEYGTFPLLPNQTVPGSAD